MRLLFICDGRDHAHCYGVDFLIQGAYALYGAENVFEWPQKPNLHLSPWEGRDACQIDSDAWLPKKNENRESIESRVATGFFDVVIMTGAYGTPTPWNEVCGRLPASTPVIGLHYDDEPTDTRGLLGHIVKRPLASYWHRENPQGGARQLWLTQPLSRLRPVEHKPNLRPVFYCGARHGPTDTNRQRMIDSVLAICPEAALSVTPDQQTARLTPEVYRERLWESSISLIWNSEANFPVYQCNRFVESLALGCAVIAERPPGVAHPNPGVWWIDSPDQAGTAIESLLREPERLRRMQRIGQDDFVQRLSSEAMLTEILRGL